MDQKNLLVQALEALNETRIKLNRLENPEPIALVGMSCRFPGGANDINNFWQLLISGADASIDVPKSRWNVEHYYDSNPDTPGKCVTRKGCFLTIPIDEFDPQFFGMSAREAQYLDPQQRLLLEVAWEALLSAKINPHDLQGSLTGVHIGISSHDYADLLINQNDVESCNAYCATGNAGSTAAGRISYVLGLQGPNESIDTACSSALVAVDVVLIDNIKVGHARLNIDAKRNIHAFMSFNIDQKLIYTVLNSIFK